jgi:hypothetical protein
MTVQLMFRLKNGTRCGEGVPGGRIRTTARTLAAALRI